MGKHGQPCKGKQRFFWLQLLVDSLGVIVSCRLSLWTSFVSGWSLSKAFVEDWFEKVQFSHQHLDAVVLRVRLDARAHKLVAARAVVGSVSVDNVAGQVRFRNQFFAVGNRTLSGFKFAPVAVDFAQAIYKLATVARVSAPNTQFSKQSSKLDKKPWCK